MTISRNNWVVSTVVATSMAMTMPANAQDAIRTVVIDGYPDRVLWLRELSGFFIPEVDRRLAEAGQATIEWQENYGGSIVKPRGVLEGVQLGLGDIGIVTTIFHSSTLPAQGLAVSTPFVASDARAVARAIDEIAQEFPAMSDEFAAQNQVYLTTGVVYDTLQVFCAEPVSSLADLEGRKVAGGGLNLRYLEGIEGAVGVRGGLTDFYNMLQTGLADCAMLWPEAAVTFKIAEVAPYMLQADLGSVNSKTLTANADYWATLPAEVQSVIMRVATDYRDRMASVAMETATEARDAYVEAGGTISVLSHEERREWARTMPNIAAEWVEVQNGQGAAGAEMLAAYLRKLEAAGFEAARDWTAE